jgi:hypothetical protein
MTQEPFVDPLQTFKAELKAAIDQLPRNPWSFSHQKINGFEFRTVECVDDYDRPFRQWELIGADGESLNITAWAAYEDGTLVDAPVEESFTLPERAAATTPAPPVPVMVIDDGDDTEATKRRAGEVDAAFGAAPFFWKDKQLAPFAIDREGDWLRHRELLDEAPLNELIRLPFAMVMDALRVIWFLAHEPREWLNLPGMKEETTEDGGRRWVRLTGKDRAILLEEKIRAWGAENVAHQEGTLLVNLFYEIYTRAQSTRALAKPGERHDDRKSKN